MKKTFASLSLEEQLFRGAIFLRANDLVPVKAAITNTLTLVISRIISSSCRNLTFTMMIIHLFGLKPLLPDTEYLKEFWVSWDGGRIQLGTGKFRSTSSTLLDHQDDIPIRVSALGWQNVESSPVAAKVRVWDYTGRFLVE